MAKFLRPSKSWYGQMSRFLSQKSNKSEAKIVLSRDESTFLVWHPQEEFPYECTKPLPNTVEDCDTSVLKTKYTPALLEIFNKKTPEQARLELMNITHTTKHRWFPKARNKKIKKSPMDREFL